MPGHLGHLAEQVKPHPLSALRPRPRVAVDGDVQLPGHQVGALAHLGRRMSAVKLVQLLLDALYVRQRLAAGVAHGLSQGHIHEGQRN